MQLLWKRIAFAVKLGIAYPLTLAAIVAVSIKNQIWKEL